MNTAFVKKANLPERKVKKCLIGEKYTEEIKELTELGINCIKIPELSTLETEINCHADIQAFYKGNGKLIISSEAGEKLKENLNEFSLTFQNDISSPYPNDVKLNATLIGNKLICNKNYVSGEILSFANENNIEIIHTNQGYSRCSLCIVNENAIITEDPGLTYLLKNCQFNVLQIQPGKIHLSDAHSGFIGGASAKISENEIYFSGDISKHPDFSQIKGFLDNYNISMVYNKSRKLADFGGIIQLSV